MVVYAHDIHATIGPMDMACWLGSQWDSIGHPFSALIGVRWHLSDPWKLASRDEGQHQLAFSIWLMSSAVRSYLKF